MKIKDNLSDDDKKMVENLSTKEEDKLSRRDILELMGANRDIYKRVRGKVRRK
jgi:hypothetical protein